MKKITMFLMLAAAAMLNACEYSMSDIMDELTIAPGSAVIYDGNGADSGEPPVDPYSYVEDSVVTVLDNTRGLVKTDTAHSSYFGFTGWNTQRDGKGTTYTTGQTFQMGKTDVTLYAMWAEGTFYRVTYSAPDATSGTLPTDNTDYASGKEVFALNNGDLARAGWTFQYWTDGFGHNYSAGDSFAITADTTLSAVWTNVPVYTVTYNGINATSGLAPVDSKNYKENEEVVVRNNGSLARTGYGFSGWNTLADGSGTTYQSGQSFFMPAVNIDLYSVWTIKDWNVRFNPNGGAGTMLDQTFTFGTTKPLTLLAEGVVPFTNSQMPVFTGWATSAAGDAVYADGANYRMLTEGADLYAAWTYHGGLDKFFGTDGIATSKMQTIGYSSAVQSDGKIVVAGSYNNGSDLDIIVMRFLPNGTLDKTFNLNGYVITNIPKTNEIGYSVAIQTIRSYEKIIVAGTIALSDTNSAFIVLRYNDNGTLDTRFGDSGLGYNITDIQSTFHDIAYSLAIQADGKIVAAGHTSTLKGSSYAVARYTSTGMLDTDVDTGFGEQFGKPLSRRGYVIPAIANTLYDTAYSVAIQPDKKIVVAGTTRASAITNNNLSLARLDTFGALDTSFNQTGYIIQDIGDNTHDYGHSVAIQADGKIVAAGKRRSLDGQKQYLFVARYTNDGTIDAGNFLKSGIALTYMGPYDSVLNYRYSVAIQADGKIVAAGTYFDGTNSSFAVARYIATGAYAGSPDDTFRGSSGDAQGLIVMPCKENGYATSVALYDDKIILAGHTGTDDQNFISVFRLWQ